MYRPAGPPFSLVQHLPAPSINHVPRIPPYNHTVWHVVVLRVQDKVVQIYGIWRYHKSEICCMYFQCTSRIRPFGLHLVAEFQGLRIHDSVAIFGSFC